MEATTIELPTQVHGTEVLLEGHFKKVKVDRYWDSHGRKVYWDDCPVLTFQDVDVKIVCTYRTVSGIDWDLWTLYIDGEETCSIEGYRVSPKRTSVTIDAPTGHG